MATNLALKSAIAMTLLLSSGGVLRNTSSFAGPQKIGGGDARFEAMAKDLKFFPTGEFIYGRADNIRFLTPNWTEPWYKALAAISANKNDVTELVGFLKHKDPKVRTLALAALFQREDPKLLPHLAAMMGDNAGTVPDFINRNANPHPVQPEPGSLHEQTVGSVARQMVCWWLRPAGFVWTTEDYKPGFFEAYWATRKDRTYCVSWFDAKFERATGGISAMPKERAGRVRALRVEIDKLPREDRDWALVYLAGQHRHQREDNGMPYFATTAEIIEAGKRIGPDRLLDLLQGKTVSDDPDFNTKGKNKNGRQSICLWVLENAGTLLRRQDAEAVLALEETFWTNWSHPCHWCVIAAATLNPAKAKEWLRGAFARYNKTFEDTNRAGLAAALWVTCGPAESGYVLDWFYSETVPLDRQSTLMEGFLQDVTEQHAQSARGLVATFINDRRFEKLDWQSLRSLIQVANRWTKTPIVPTSELYQGWEGVTWAPKTDADFRRVQEWRAKLKASVPEWH